ncbi:ubiquinol-cytochrome c reductase iron-sulfur subunit [Pseudomonas syringae]|nr:ubiquinol-cytochrome c reductase iron-sulfur subunit [Pseudomonas syringae]MBD8573533.1 ubiquinol-cytochrome c reductase iron-sulfur subunit [Pseudomonas syringae]MBD8790014.1 ubiquinol-cytochrome c reductase iron-sulfur subunit [Pseudomonas syringae]MBD8799989.1 ubiquinol-cytochrome c reductase iron-sulfur subunit [Pseudomonas syringae]MBD8811015.1 ubiquinol-cytochrome c reductase iron-sulfur subunit [Pseudomonas syringae]
MSDDSIQPDPLHRTATAAGLPDVSQVNPQRRRFLVASTSLVAAAGLAGAAVPFVGSWFPGARARAAGAPVKINIDKIEPGQQVVVEWRGQPVFILHRTPQVLDALGAFASQLADPESRESVQPAYVDRLTRSIKPQILLLVGLCTHLGCSPTFRPEVAPPDLGKDWPGGYFCPCHGSRYDLAGRVYKAQPAPLNLPVPPHRYESDTVIVIGVDQEGAS